MGSIGFVDGMIGWECGALVFRSGVHLSDIFPVDLVAVSVDLNIHIEFSHAGSTQKTTIFTLYKMRVYND